VNECKPLEFGELSEEEGELGELGEISPSPKYTYTSSELFERRRQMEQATSGQLPLPAAVNPAWVPLKSTQPGRA